MAQSVEDRDRRGAAADGSRRIYALWGVALALLVSAGLFCRLVVIPFRETKAAVEAYAKRNHYSDDRILLGCSGEELTRLGGPAVAAGRLAGYLRLPASIAPHPRLAIIMLTDCREHSWPYLPCLLRHPEAAARRRAAEGLGLSKNPRVVPLLIATLRDPDSQVQRAAAHALGSIGDPRAFEPLLAALNEPHFREKAVAAESLIRTGGARAIRPLCGYLESCWKDNWWEGYVVEELAELKDPRTAEALAVALHIHTRWTQSTASDALVKIGAPAVGYLIAALRSAEPDRRYSLEVRDVLVGIGQPAVEPLLAALKDRNAEVRWTAAAALGWIRERRAAEPIIELLDDPDWKIRVQAAESLGYIGDQRAVAPLIALLALWDTDREEARELRFAALDALTDIGRPAVPALITALRNPDHDVRRHAAWVLGRIGHRRALGRLLGSLRDCDPDVRASAAEALGNLRRHRAWRPLLRAIKDPECEVRCKAVRALARIDGRRAIKPLEAALEDKEGWVRYEACLQLEKIRAELAGENKPQ